MLPLSWGKTITHSQPTVRQVLTLTFPWPLLTFLPGMVAILSQQLLTFPWKEAVSPRWQLLTFPWKEAVSNRQLLSFLLGKEAMVSWQLLTFPWKEAVPPRWQLLTFPWKEAVHPRPLLSFLPVKAAVIPRQVNLTTLLGQSGRTAGIPPDTGPPSHPRRTAPSPGKIPPPLPP